MNTALLVILAILWLNSGIRATREMEEVDGDALEWIALPLVAKVCMVLISPVLMLIYERHIFETRKKS